MFVAAMGPPGGGRTFITPRYVRHFHCVALTETPPTSLAHIFSTIQDWFLTTRGFPAPVHELKCVPMLALGMKRIVGQVA